MATDEAQSLTAAQGKTKFPSENVKEHVDDAKKFLDANGPITWTLEDERKVLRKIDLRILPLVFLLQSYLTYASSC